MSLLDRRILQRTYPYVHREARDNSRTLGRYNNKDRGGGRAIIQDDSDKQNHNKFIAVDYIQWHRSLSAWAPYQKWTCFFLPSTPLRTVGKSSKMEGHVLFFVSSSYTTTTGMGGGFVMIPLMTSRNMLGLSQHVAHGTSLFAVATTGIAGALGYGITSSQNNATS
eukprot:1509242-Ditylum_brightwellii.AAC.1